MTLPPRSPRPRADVSVPPATMPRVTERVAPRVGITTECLPAPPATMTMMSRPSRAMGIGVSGGPVLEAGGMARPRAPYVLEHEPHGPADDDIGAVPLPDLQRTRERRHHRPPSSATGPPWRIKDGLGAFRRRTRAFVIFCASQYAQTSSFNTRTIRTGPLTRPSCRGKARAISLQRLGDCCSCG